MTSTANKTIAKVLTTLMMTTSMFSIAAAARTVDGRDNRAQVEALCEAETGSEVALVTLKNDQPFLEVFNGSRLVKAQYATRDYSYSGGVLIMSYKTGAVTRGGVSLRIRAHDSDAADLEGFGHLTLKTGSSFSNKLMNCHIY